MRESRLKAECLQHGASHLPAALQMISFDVAQCDRLGTNPLFLAGDQGARPIQAHVPERDFAVDADRVERVLHRLDEFLDIDVPGLSETSEHGIELEPRVDAEGISRAGPGDGLHDDGETDLLRRALALGRVRRAPVPGRTNACFRNRLLHRVFVAEQSRLRDVLPLHAQFFPQLRRQDHARFPQALDLFDGLSRFPASDLLYDRRLIEQRRHLQIAGEVRAHELRQVMLRLIADAKDPGALHRQSTGEVIDFRGISR